MVFRGSRKRGAETYEPPRIHVRSYHGTSQLDFYYSVHGIHGDIDDSMGQYQLRSLVPFTHDIANASLLLMAATQSLFTGSCAEASAKGKAESMVDAVETSWQIPHCFRDMV